VCRQRIPEAKVRWSLSSRRMEWVVGSESFRAKCLHKFITRHTRKETKSSAMVRHLKDNSEKRSDQLSGAGGMP